MGGADGGPWESKPSPGSPLAYVPHAGPAMQPAPPFCGSSPWPPDHCHLLSAVFSTPMKTPQNQETLAPCCSMHFSFFPVCPRPECLNLCMSARQPVHRLGGWLPQRAQVRVSVSLSCVLVLRTGLRLALGQSPAACHCQAELGRWPCHQPASFSPSFLMSRARGRGRNLNVSLPSGTTEKPPRSYGVGQKGSPCVSGGLGAHPANPVRFPVLYLLFQRLSLCVPLSSFASLYYM